jgi:hypothetical protein
MLQIPVRPGCSAAPFLPLFLSLFRAHVLTTLDCLREPQNNDTALARSARRQGPSRVDPPLDVWKQYSILAPSPGSLFSSACCPLPHHHRRAVGARRRLVPVPHPAVGDRSPNSSGESHPFLLSTIRSRSGG